MRKLDIIDLCENTLYNNENELKPIFREYFDKTIDERKSIHLFRDLFSDKNNKPDEKVLDEIRQDLYNILYNKAHEGAFIYKFELCAVAVLHSTMYCLHKIAHPEI